MNSQLIMDTAKALMAGNKGVIAMDESNSTCNRRFALLGIPETEEARRDYRELIVTTRNLSDYTSGAILFDETIRQKTKNGIPFVQVLNEVGILPGIKVDCGAKDMAGQPGEKITEGLDGLRERLAEYSQMGAKFAKWRSVIAIIRLAAVSTRLNQWGRLPACRVENDRLEAYPTSAQIHRNPSTYHLQENEY